MSKRTTPTYPVEVIRSDRRTRTVSARLVGGKILIRIPASMSKKDEKKFVAEMVDKVRTKTRSSAPTDEALLHRAQHLNRAVLENRATIGSIRWVTNQTRRWGSCSQATNDIRISHRLQGVPDYVLDAVIIHEMVHTFIEGGHSPEFWQWADKAPKAERAKGYLEAWQRMGDVG
ncbi:M48 metallopeptidase family protein [Corynebacterium belfantii]|uniref:M48 metallopeptidase family protein n=1 Tax=Corynebacterium belfantii TaxID=2014537 RepID=UPI00248BE46D|nr:SprT-like domain-containing protein [Corynebacterium belfantii]